MYQYLVPSAEKYLPDILLHLQTDLEEMNSEIRAADDKAKKSIAEANHLAEELRAEQEHSAQIEKFRKGLESQIKELQVRLDEAEASALKGGKKMIAKLENRVSVQICLKWWVFFLKVEYMGFFWKIQVLYF